MNRRSFFRTLVAASPASGPSLQQVETESTGMGRRDFLRLLTASTAVTTAALVAGVDVDRLLWVPEKTLVLPPAGGWPRLTDDRLVQRELRERRDRGPGLKNLAAMACEVAREIAARREAAGLPPMILYDAFHCGRGDDSLRVGDTVRVAEPLTFDLSLPFDPNAQITRQFKEVVLDQQLYCDFAVSAQEQAAGVPREMLQPVAVALEQYVRRKGLTLTARQSLPVAADASAEWRDEKSGVAVRAIKVYDPISNQTHIRFDVLGGKA